jgi:hypothetical protein
VLVRKCLLQREALDDVLDGLLATATADGAALFLLFDAATTQARHLFGAHLLAL